jgi:site-specific recombinase XerD
MFCHDTHHPKEMGSADIEALLTHLAVQQKVAASTQNQALSAPLCLYRDVIRQPLDGSSDVIQARKPTRLPTVLNKEEALQVIGALSGTHTLMATWLSGTGLRLMECLQLRATDLDFAPQQIVVRHGQGRTIRSLYGLLALSSHSRYMRQTPPQDMAQSMGPSPWQEHTHVPAASGVGRKCFPHTRCREIPARGLIRRHHAHECELQRAVSQASRAAGLTTRLSGHPVRHRLATPLLQQGDEIRTVHARLGHNDVKTTMRYTPVLTRGRLAVRSPLDERGCPCYVPAFFEP